MKITQVTVTTEDGQTLVWDAPPREFFYGMDLTAWDDPDSHDEDQFRAVQITLPPRDFAATLNARTVARSAETGRFTTAEDAAEHPATTVTEQL